MTKRNLLSIIFALIILLSLSSCKTNNSEKSGIEVIYELNGGIFQNCSLPIKQYYTYPENSKRIIVDPETLVSDVIQKAGYVLEGWYTDAEFTNKWDFENDEITPDGLTLYAKWEKDIKYTYNVCYIDEITNELVIINSYEVEAGQKFEDYRKYANKRSGYTAYRFYQENGEDWDFNFEHPGGDTDVAVNVYVEYIPGEYALVSTKEEFIKAVSKGENIYLLNDIDLEYEEVEFGDFSKQLFEGNNFTVKNFKVFKNIEYPQHLTEDHTDSLKNSVYVSLFGNVEDSTIKNVNFENMIFEISVSPTRTYKIYVAPLATSYKNSTIENVTIDSTYSVIKLPNGFDESANLVISIENYITYSENTIIENILLKLEKGE